MSVGTNPPTSETSALRLAYVTIHDPHDVRAWSGLTFHMAQALMASGLQIAYVGPLHQRYHLPLKAKQLVYRELLHKRHMRDWEPTIVKGYAHQVHARLMKLDADALFVPGTSLPAITHLEWDRPIVAWCDATFAALVDLYPRGNHGDVHAPGWSNLSSQTLRYGVEGEQAAMRKCTRLVFSSRWSAKSAINAYGIEASKVEIVRFGANLTTEMGAHEIQERVSRRSRHKCNLLFLGGEWRRKGGPMAVAVAEELNRLGLPTQLTVVGCTPTEPLPPFVEVAGFLDKSTRAGEERLTKLLEDSHFLILPSTADCTPVALSEAGSRGVPSLARQTGGVADIVIDGRNGKVFAPTATAQEWAKFVLDCLSSWPTYFQLGVSSFEEYSRNLNWRRNGQEVAATIRQAVDDIGSTARNPLPGARPS